MRPNALYALMRGLSNSLRFTRERALILALSALAAGHRHMPRHRRAGLAVDDEIMAFRLARDRLQRWPHPAPVIALAGAQRRAQIGGIVLAQAHIQRAGAGQPHAVAALAEIMRQRRDEADALPGLRNVK